MMAAITIATGIEMTIARILFIFRSYAALYATGIEKSGSCKAGRST